MQRAMAGQAPPVVQPKVFAPKGLVVTKARPVARPQPAGVTQTKGAPPVYRPSVTTVLRQTNAAPPVFRPQPTGVMQTKGAPPVYRPSVTTVLRRTNAAPPVFRPQPTGVMQAKGAPPVYRPSVATVLRKKDMTHPVFSLRPARAPEGRSGLLKLAHIVPVFRGPRQTIQRLAINLQKGDSVIDKIENYMTNKLSVQDEILTSFPTTKRQLRQDENIYLYGHGSTLDLRSVMNDRFGKQTVEQIAQGLADSCTFPEDYTGSVYLIGCKTLSMVASLKHTLAAKISRSVPVFGTPELMTTSPQGDVSLRHPPKDAEDAEFRQQLDTFRSVLQVTIFDLYKAWNSAVEAFAALPSDVQQVSEQDLKNAIRLAEEAREKHRIRQEAVAVNAQALETETNPILVGKHRAFASVENLLKLALDDDYDKAFAKFCECKKWNPQKILDLMQTTLKDLEEWKVFFIKSIQNYDEQHSKEQSPFNLSLMEG